MLIQNLDEYEVQIKEAIARFTPDAISGNPAEFQQVANGIFQAEGSVSAQITVLKGKAYISPIVAISQNFSSRALDFFVRLYFELGKRGRITAYISASDKVHLKYYICEGWTSFDYVSGYFSFLYGEKFKAFNKLADIFKLKSLTDDVSKTKVIYLFKKS